MRVAILLIGHIRTWDKCIKRFRDKFKSSDSIKFDVFINTYSMRYGYHPWIQKCLNYYEDEYVAIEKNDLYKSVEIENQVDVDTALNSANLHDRMKDIYHGYLQYRKLSRCLDQMKQYEIENNFTYDLVVKTRFDAFYTDLDIYYNSYTMIIDSNNTQPNDHLIVCSRDNMIKLAEFVLSEYINPTSDLSFSKPPHGVLEYFILSNNIGVVSQNHIQRIIRK